jgi:pimeloyl-ACP methyl ester carboxylesterase
MRYLLGESLGGAVALLLHRKKPDFWDGAVLVAPMCKVTLYIMSFTFGLSPLSSLSDYFLFSKVTSSFGSFSLYIFIYIHGLPTKLDPVLVTLLLLSVFLFFILSMVINFNENKN